MGHRLKCCVNVIWAHQRAGDGAQRLDQDDWPPRGGQRGRPTTDPARVVEPASSRVPSTLGVVVVPDPDPASITGWLTVVGEVAGGAEVRTSVSDGFQTAFERALSGSARVTMKLQ